MKYRKLKYALTASVVVGLTAVLCLANHELPSLISSANAAPFGKDKPMVSPTKPRERDFYAPNSEKLASDEIRIIACGTGMPNDSSIHGGLDV